MTVSFDEVLVCGTRDVLFENNKYYSFDVYQDGMLYRISISEKDIDNIVDHVGEYVSFYADLKVFNGKSKFKFKFYKEN